MFSAVNFLFATCYFQADKLTDGKDCRSEIINLQALRYRNSIAEIHCLRFPQASIMANYFFSLQALQHLKGHPLCPGARAYSLCCRKKQKWAISHINWRNAEVGYEIQRATTNVGRTGAARLHVLETMKTEYRISTDHPQRGASPSPCGHQWQVSTCTDTGHSQGQLAGRRPPGEHLPSQALAWYLLPAQGHVQRQQPPLPRGMLPAPACSSQLLTTTTTTTSGHSGPTLFRVPPEMENLSKCRRHISTWHAICTKHCAKILQEKAEGQEK